MLLRPATPLSLILLIAFALLLLATLSTPIIHSIPLGTRDGKTYGTFGYCVTDTNTCHMGIGYRLDALSGDGQLSGQLRHSLSSILIVHPVAAFLTLICFCLASAAHLRSPSHSPRYLLALLILTIPTLLVSLLAFLVDILLFVPHVLWGGWIVLAATILIIASLVVTCAMRRTLVSRKARKKRIAENSEMNGQVYYDNLAERNAMPMDQLPRAESPPPMSVLMNDKSGHTFATYEMGGRDNQSQESAMGRRSEDRTPLNPVRDPSVRSMSSGGGRRRPMDENAPPMPVERHTSSDSSLPGTAGRGPPRDQYGNIMPAPMNQYGNPQGMRDPNGRQRGRGGPTGRGRGFGPSRGGWGHGPPPGRNSPGQYGRGDYGHRPAPRGLPPPGWNGRGRGGYGLPPGNMARGYGPAPAYGHIIDHYGAPASGPPPPIHTGQGMPMGDEHAIGRAIEMDERTGQANPLYAPPHSRQDGVETVTMPGMEHDGVADHSGLTPEDEYVPPRTQWAPSSPRQHGGPGHVSPVSPISPVHETSMGRPTSGAGRGRAESETYYEDMDPRFAIDPASDVGVDNGLPSALTPGGLGSAAGQRLMPSPNHLHPTHNISYPSNTDSHVSGESTSIPSSERQLDLSDEALPDGACSPGEGSEASHFTSISQRGVNPNWRPGYAGLSALGPGPSQRRKDDVILTANPDFSLPGMGPRGRGAANTLPRGAVSSSAAGLTPAGRYPTEF